MKPIKLIILIAGFLVHLTGYGQNDTLLKKEHVNMATLIVDYDTYTYDGGNISYYSCSDCPNDSIPFSIDFYQPGDFGEIAFKLHSTSDTVFDAGIIWMGTGEIAQPKDFDTTYPFDYTGSNTGKPHDMRYIHVDGTRMNDSSLKKKAASAWNIIDSLAITNIFGDKDFEAAIYLYPPSVGMFDPSAAKWIIFLYYNDKTNAIDHNANHKGSIYLYPNPTEGNLTLKTDFNSTNTKHYKIFNPSGKIRDKGQFEGNTYQLDVSSFAAGLYYMTLIDDKGNAIKSEKIIIH